MSRGGDHVAVVGGGLGGLAAACTLAARRHRVTLLEGSATVGGKAAVLEEQGYRFDMGPTILTLPGVLRRIFAEAGRALEDEVELVRLDPQWRTFFPDGSVLDLEADPNAMAARLERFAPGKRLGEGYRAFLDLSARIHDVSERYFFWKPVGSVFDTFDARTTFRLSVLADLASLRAGSTVSGIVRRHLDDPRVAQLADHFTQYVGSAPDRSPAVLCGIAHMQSSEGVWYPRGGTRAVVTALERLALALGVEIRTGSAVRRIDVEDGAAVGIRTDAGETIAADAVVSNADVVRTHRDLLGGRAWSRFARRRRYEPACSGIVLYLGLDRGYDHLLHHDFVFSADPHEEFDAIYRRGEPAADPTCYVCAPARTDPTVAPAGGEALYVLVHVPYLRPHHDWRRRFPAYRRTILDKLERTAGLDGLESRIVFERALTPLDIRDRYRVPEGAIYGLASHGRFLGAFKPGNRSADVRGLYLAGGSAHPGPGMPMALMSGWIAADALDQDRPARAAPSTRAEAPRPSLPARGVDEPRTPEISPLLLRAFVVYVRRYLARHFHAIRLARSGARLDAAGDEPLVVYLNHPSWWDPLLALLLADRLLGGRRHYAPIEAAALDRYAFFSRLGFFGVEPGTVRGAARFLALGERILAEPGAVLWLTPQGRFADARERPPRLKRGLAHLLRRVPRATAIPVALELAFWQERTPEALIRVGEPLRVDERRARPDDIAAALEARLVETQDALAVDVRGRDADAFEILLGGDAGVGGVYDVWRRLRALARGERFRREHGFDAR